MTKTLLFQEGSSNKFWRVTVEGATLTVIYGRIGTAGRSESKEFKSEAEAKKEAEKLLAEKLKKGYHEDKNSGFGEEDFWKIIDRARKASQGDPDRLADLVEELLESRPISEIIIFGDVFNRLHRQSYRSDWWAAAYLINSGCSDDGFEDFRAWVISRGQKVYDEAWKNPESLMHQVNAENIGDCQAETLLFTADHVYERKTGKDDFYKHLSPAPMPTLVFDWQEDDDSLQIKFPKLAEKCKKLWR